MKLQDLTLAEIEQLEDAAKMSITQLEDPRAPKGRLMRAIAFITVRRDDPSFSWDDAGALRMDELDALISLGEEDADDPTPPAVPNA